MPTETQLMERIHAIENANSVLSSQITELKESCKYLWESVKAEREEREKLRCSLSDIRVQSATMLGAFGVVQTVITAVIVWKITH